jgi:hypothetical protein
VQPARLDFLEEILSSCLLSWSVVLATLPKPDSSSSFISVI